MDKEKLIMMLLKGDEKTSSNDNPYQIGKNYFIRTVTMSLCGKLVKAEDKELVLENAAWIADTGRFSNFVREGTISSSAEIEPFPEGEVIVGRGSIVDACIWKHELPKEQKHSLRSEVGTF